MKVFPSAIVVQNRLCLVVGDDHEAKDKTRRLRKAGALVSLVSLKSFRLAQIQNQFFVVFCPKDQPRLVKKVAQKCRSRRVLLCAIDQPEYCDVSNTAVYERGDLKVMVSTSGVSPMLSRKIVEGLERSLGRVPIEKYLRRLKHLRQTLFQKKIDPFVRRRQLMEAASGVQFKAALSWGKVRKRK